MIVMLQTQGLKSLDDLRAFLAGSQGVEIRTPEREAAYAFIGQTLKRFGYARLGKAEKGLVRAYLGKVTGLSRAQLSRLAGRAQAGEALRDRRSPPAKPFARRYTPEDVRLLAEVDAWHGNLSGPATRKLCERAWEVFGDARYAAPGRDLQRSPVQPAGLPDLPALPGAGGQDPGGTGPHRRAAPSPS